MEIGRKVKEVWAMRIKLLDCLTDFGKGIIVGFLLSAIVFGIILGFMVHRNKVKEIVNYVETQQAIELLREDYVNRDPFEFFEVPGVRRAADGTVADFERRRDEIIYRFRNRLAD